MKKRTLIIIASIVVLLGGGFLAIFPWGMSDLSPQGINPATIADGSYTGTFSQGRFTNTVTVHIENGVITGIDMVDDVMFAGIMGITEDVLDQVIRAQNTQIDTISGSTLTMNAYLMAIEVALAARN
jgi:uncharacterized protein with FMN-binding domain